MTVDAALPLGHSHVVPGFLGEVRRTGAGSRRDIDHWHDDVEFDLVLRGTATYVLDERVYTAPPGTLIWLMPGQRHKLIRSPNMQLWVIYFRAELLEPGWREDLERQPSRIVSSHDLIDLDALFSEVAQDSDEPAVYNAGLTYAIMRALRASRHRPSAARKPMHPAVARALLILRQAGGAPSLSELASAAAIAPHYLSRLLAEQTGRSFVEWRSRIRLDRFMEGYTPGVNLLSAALDAGFGSYARFHHIFATVVGCSPSEWVARVEQGKAAPRLGAAAPEPGHRAPGARLLSARQRWTTLIPLVAPALRKVVDSGYLDRMLAPPRATRSLPSHLADLDTSITDEDADAFIASLRDQDPELADDFRRLLAMHDFDKAYCDLMLNFRRTPGRLSDQLGGVMAACWSAMRDFEISLEEAAGVCAQAERALAVAPPRLTETELRAARVAIQAHLVVFYHAAVAARASADERQFEAIRAGGRQWSQAVFGEDISRLEASPAGFARPRTVATAQVRRALAG